MGAKRMKLIVLISLCILSLPAIISPPQTSMATEAIFEDPAMQRIKSEGNDSTISAYLIIRVQHEDLGPLTSNFSRVEQLYNIEQEARTSTDSNYSFDSNKVYIKRLETPFSAWEGAFNTRNKSLANAASWGEVLQPTNEEGWCSEEANAAENNALQATLLLLPKESNIGVACPEFAGASATQPPQANELLWLIWLDSSEKPVDWSELSIWCEKISANSEFNFEPAGVNMLFKEAELIAKDDLSKILPITAVILLAILWLFFRDIQITLMTLGSVVLVVLAVIGFLQLFDYQFSVIDGIAIPIIMGVAVDGAFWYKSSNKPTKEVREILLLAMATTVAAVSLALFSPIKAQRGLALVMIIGIVFDWLLTRFVLEEYYLKFRTAPIVNDGVNFSSENKIKWGWPVALLTLVMIAVTSPTGVEALDINQFLPEDSESLDELSELRDMYVIASSTIVFITFDLDNADSRELSNLNNFKQQFVQHPNIIAYDTGLSREILVLGLDDISGDSSFDDLYDSTTESILVKDPWLRVDGEVTGAFILAVIDGENAQSAYQFSLDTQDLLDDNDLSGEIGGDLITGISLAKSFEQTRILQIIFAGIIVFTISRAMTGSTNRAARIAVGTIAVGIAVDGLASHLGGRGVNTAPAVLLGMGFAADYLSHASDKITSWKFDNMARWGAAITSCSVFFVVSFSKFPPAKDTGVLLTLTIIISVFLATLLSTVSHEGAIKQQEE